MTIDSISLLALTAAGMVAGLALPARATVRLPALVGSHMVLQRDRPVPVWGWAAPGETVRVSFRNARYTATADASGRWQTELAAQPAGGPFMLSVQGDAAGDAAGNAIELTDVLVGDVWLAAGQSNMQFKVKDPNRGGYQPVQNADQEIAAANFPDIRFFTVGQKAASQPQPEAAGSGWQVCGPGTVAEFSAVAYFFARDLHQRYHVPVGVVVSSWGGTPAETWVSAEGLRAFPEFRSGAPSIPAEPQSAPAALYNGMIAPLRLCAFRGVLWYQGETNVGRAAQYRTLFPALIADWRRQWGAELPFLFVQLANWKPALPAPAESDWAELREAQTCALALPRTGMATAIDLGEADDIHPHNKQAVGARLALVARRMAYGEKDVVDSGPTFAKMTVTGRTVRLAFNHRGGGLVARDGPLRGFAVAGANQVFYWATAEIKGNEVVVNSATVPAPVAVRYDWADNPAGNLYNREGLPTVPFRTDTPPRLSPE